MGKIIYLMGKSSVGKDTIYKELLKKEGNLLKPVILYTTRPMREGEQQGREYFFVDNSVLAEYEKKGKIIEMREYHTVHGIWAYATVDDGQIDLSKANYLAIGTLESYEQIKRYYGEDKLFPVYLTVDDGIRLERAIKRERKQVQPHYAEMCRRFLADEEDFSKENLERSGIHRSFSNDDLEECVEKIWAEIQEIS